MRMNSNIILSGRQPNVLAALQQGTAAAAQTNEVNKQNALARLYNEQGEGIMSGDANALAALGRIDPITGLNIKSTHHGMDMDERKFDLTKTKTQHDMRISSANLQLARQAGARAAANFAAQADARQAEAALQKVTQGLAAVQTAQTPEQWDALAQQYQPELVGKFEQKDAIIAFYTAGAEGLGAVLGGGGSEPAAMQTLRARAAAAGLAEGSPEYQAFMANGGRVPEQGFEFTGPDGTRVRFGGTAEVPAPISPSSPDAMVSSIDGILSDPALDKSTGVYAPLQNVPGTPQRRFGARANQLEGQAFLQAFESLKGGGHITEIEGVKATQAIGRLDTAQSPDDYRAALQELRETLATGIARRDGVAQPKPQASSGLPQSFIDAMGTTDMAPQELWGLLSPEDRALWQ